MADVLWPIGGGLVRVLLLPWHAPRPQWLDFVFSGTFWPPTWLALGVAWCVAVFALSATRRPTVRERRSLLVLGAAGLVTSLWAGIAMLGLTQYEVAAGWYESAAGTTLSPGQSWLQVVRPVPWVAGALCIAVIAATWRWRRPALSQEQPPVAAPNLPGGHAGSGALRLTLASAGAAFAVLAVDAVRLRHPDIDLATMLWPLTGSPDTQSTALYYLFAVGWLMPVLVLLPLVRQLPRVGWALALGTGVFGVITVGQDVAYLMQAWASTSAHRSVAVAHLLAGQIVARSIALLLCCLVTAGGLLLFSGWSRAALESAPAPVRAPAEPVPAVGEPSKGRSWSARVFGVVAAALLALALVGIAAPRLVPSENARVPATPRQPPTALPAPQLMQILPMNGSSADLPTVVGVTPSHSNEQAAPYEGWDGRLVWVSLRSGKRPVVAGRCKLWIDGVRAELAHPPTIVRMAAGQPTVQFELTRVRGKLERTRRFAVDIVTSNRGHVQYSWSY